MIRCKCMAEPRIRQAMPVQMDGKAYWLQIFTCDNPQCENYQKDIGERRTNISDEQDTTEKMY